MSDQYLWDKSGAPDEEIEQLERTLCVLRYQPSKNTRATILDATRAAALPVAAQSSVKYHYATRYAPAFAIAATLLLAIIAGNAWLKIRAPQTIKKSAPQLAATTTIAPPDKAPSVQPDYPTTNVSANPVTTTQNNLSKQGQTFAAPHKSQSRAAERRLASMPEHSVNSPRVGKDNDASRVEGERAKEQLVLALYIASEKLHSAQKKIQVNKDDVPAS
jgi:hypothetical protein